MRVCFYNPNNDSGQDWGGDVVVSTSGNGERYGEGLLEFEKFLSRLYLFHDDPLRGDMVGADVPSDTIAEVQRLAEASWAAQRIG